MTKFMRKLGGEFMNPSKRDLATRHAYLRGDGGAVRTCRTNFGKAIAQTPEPRCRSVRRKSPRQAPFTHHQISARLTIILNIVWSPGMSFAFQVAALRVSV
jgi:hypothetical protein